MSAAVAVDLLASAAISFMVAAVLVLAVLRLFRVPAGPWRVALLLLPFAKLGVDLTAGVPDNSYLWATLDGDLYDSGHVMVGLGVLAPAGIKLSVMMGAVVDGQVLPASVGAALVRGLEQLGGWSIPSVLVLVSAVGCWRVTRRMAEQRDVRCRWRGHHRRLARARCGGRWVDILLLPSSAGLDVPFAGGVLRPYVCVPEHVWEALSPGEREAVIAHELGHVALFHPLLMCGVDLLAQVFWFVPFMAQLTRRLADACEQWADGWALGHGAERMDLATAMVQVSEMVVNARWAWGRALGFGVSRRIARLAGAEPITVPRFGWKRFWVRLVVTLLTTQAVLLLVIGGYS